jgi:hypothetical protein
MHRLPIILWAVTLLTGPAAMAQPLAMEPLKGEAASLHWAGAQFLQADAQGQVFLLRSEPLEIYPLTRSHDLGKAERVDGRLSSGNLSDAAMSPQGEWLLRWGTDIDLVAGGHATRLPEIPWRPISVGFLSRNPVVGVMPPRMIAGERADDPSSLPLLMSVSHDSWATEMSEATLKAPDRHFDMMAELASRSVRVLDEGGGRYLVARQYAYRIELRRTGRQAPLEELRVGKGEVILKGGAEPDQRLVQEIKKEGMNTSGMTATAFHGVFAILALTHGPGGRIYVLLGPGIATDGKCALDRIEWDARRVERLPLNVPCDQRQSLAAGGDGLYLAGYEGAAGRYFVPWDALDMAKWAPVKQANFEP